MEKLDKKLPIHLEFLGGGLAGVSEISLLYPLDVLKTRMQIQVGSQQYKSFVDCFFQIVKGEGTSRLYRGIAAPIMVEAPKRAVKFAANGAYGPLYKKLFNEEKMTQKLSILTGVSAGCTEAVVIAPFELVKIRMQAIENIGRYHSTFDCARDILKTHGLKGFLRGMEATVWRHAWWNGGFFGSIFWVRSHIPKSDNHKTVLLNNFIAGSIGGTIGTILNTPFDVVKTRIQSSRITNEWTLSHLLRLARTEGASSLYKGFWPKVLRLGPGGGILLLVFEQYKVLMAPYALQC